MDFSYFLEYGSILLKKIRQKICMTPHSLTASLDFPFPHNKRSETPLKNTQKLSGHFDLKHFRALCILHITYQTLAGGGKGEEGRLH